MTSTDNSDPLPPILVTIMDDAVQPDVTVAPAGRVRVMAINRGEQAHGLILVRSDGRFEVAGTVAAIEPGGGGETEVDLRPGRYVFFVDANIDRGMRAEITVQPSETYMQRRDEAASA